MHLAPHITSFDPVTTARLKACDEARECLQRTRRIMARCYPNWELPRGNPFMDADARAVFVSPARSSYILHQRRMAKVIADRIAGKIAGRGTPLNQERIAA